MTRRISPYQKDLEEQPASREVSRLLVVGFLIAAPLGVVTGAAWIAWSLFRIHVLGW